MVFKRRRDAIDLRGLLKGGMVTNVTQVVVVVVVVIRERVFNVIAKWIEIPTFTFMLSIITHDQFYMKFKGYLKISTNKRATFKNKNTYLIEIRKY